MKTKIIFSIFLVALIISVSNAQEVPVGLGSYNLAIHPGEPPSPGQWDGSWFDAPAAKPRVTTSFNQHPTTHEWWSSFIWDPGLNTSHSYANWAYPTAIRADQYGLQVYKNRLDNITNTFPHMYNHNTWPHQAINVGITGFKADSTKVVSYGDWHLKARWDNKAGHWMRQLQTVLLMFISNERAQATLKYGLIGRQ